MSDVQRPATESVRCRSVCQMGDERWGSIGNRCELVDGHDGAHESVLDACRPHLAARERGIERQEGKCIIRWKAQKYRDRNGNRWAKVTARMICYLLRV